ncbi:MAG: hypothetical protein KME16_28065 [Scytolyngbya sp. HA4215-MV1]|nr:hypothetical protein [Scytolyngbya sp. HA4215-MV1]
MPLAGSELYDRYVRLKWQVCQCKAKTVVQLSLFKTSERSEGVDPSRRRGVCPSNPSRWVGDYACVRGGRYFRFYYQEWNAATQRLKTKHVAIRGGNTANTIAQRNAQIVREAIAAGKSDREIVRLIRSHKAQTGNYKRVIVDE